MIVVHFGISEGQVPIYILVVAVHLLHTVTMFYKNAVLASVE